MAHSRQTHPRGPLRVAPTNPGYSANDSGRAIYLTGSRTWASLVEIKIEGDPDLVRQVVLWAWNPRQGAAKTL